MVKLMELLITGLRGLQTTGGIRQALPDIQVIAMSVLEAKTVRAAAPMVFCPRRSSTTASMKRSRACFNCAPTCQFNHF
jgi:hypothetical protein